MPDFSLVPVDHQPDFSDVSLVPVDHDPFGADGVTQQTQIQPESQPQPPAKGTGQPDVGAPAVGDGGQFSAGTAIGNKAADIASKLASGMMHQIATLPQRALEASAADVQHLGEGAYTPQSIGPAAETALMTMGPPARFKSASRLMTDTAASDANLLASRSAGMYNPPAKPPRPFEADYPSGAPSDVAGNLSKDIDGRNLTARIVVGRRTLGGADEALTPTQLDAAATAALGSPIQSGPASALPRNTVGAYRDTRGPDGPERGITVLSSLDQASKNRVSAHEFGHAIDDLAGEIPTAGLSDELKLLYNTLNTGRERSRNLTGPQHFGYAGDDVPREYIAEAIRAYMADPNYIKTVAPKTAARIREFVNSNPRLNKIIQFNSVAVPVGAGVVNANSNDDR